MEGDIWGDPDVVLDQLENGPYLLSEIDFLGGYSFPGCWRTSLSDKPVKISVPFYDEVFILKAHIQMVRQKIIDLNRPHFKNSDVTNLNHSFFLEKIE